MALAAATGFFDGVHSGHRAVLREIKRTASERGLESAIITFWPHPRFVLGQDAGHLRLLNTLEEKKSLLTGLGITNVHVIPFTQELGRMGAREFIVRYLAEKYGVETVVIGYDHRMGRENVSGEKLASLITECGLNVSLVEETEVGNSHVSSTVIRRLLEQGEMDKASRLLGYDYSMRYGDFLSGVKVKPGEGRYRVSLDYYGCIVEAECVLKGSDIVVNACPRPFSDDTLITFLEKIY